jgi:hypothetical protein
MDSNQNHAGTYHLQGGLEEASAPALDDCCEAGLDVSNVGYAVCYRRRKLWKVRLPSADGRGAER